MCYFETVLCHNCKWTDEPIIKFCANLEKKKAICISESKYIIMDQMKYSNITTQDTIHATLAIDLKKILVTEETPIKSCHHCNPDKVTYGTWEIID